MNKILFLAALSLMACVDSTIPQEDIDELCHLSVDGSKHIVMLRDNKNRLRLTKPCVLE